MSSPLSSLRKSHKAPFMPGSGQRPVPFRNPDYSEDESKLLDEVTTGMASSRMKGRDPFVGGLPKIESRHPSQVSSGTSPGRDQGHPSASPSDRELLSLMMSRVTHLEAKLQYQTKENAEKDRRVRVLEDKLKILQKAQGGGNSGERVQELEKKCLLLQQQIHEMEAFLSDYGMVWVGEKIDPESDVYNEDVYSSGGSEDDVWRPGSSVSRTPAFHLDYDRLIENIQDLNVLAGEGVAKIQHTTDGARLRIQDPIPLTLYANGIMLFKGPFRPFSDPETQLCVKDLTDGYFPSELQNRYPEGVPFKVTDLRKVSFHDKRREDLFTGAGQMLGGDTKPSRLVPSNLDKAVQHHDLSSNASSEFSGEVTSQLPGPQLTVEQFLNKLPSSVVKQGKVIDIRSSLGEHIHQGKDSKTGSGVVVVETAVTTEMKKRLEADEGSRPATPRDITTLRIKSGDQTYIIKMRFQNTVGDLRLYLNKQRHGLPHYQIMSAYPHRIYNDSSLTLDECGLTPNAVLHLRPVKKS
ncbi:UBX domain-containing protein 11-like [Haliotis cracherodii]|uniref:UBX domain-containing protein 11-like n=1 Tax=Haliotis cracherodii TaxID=6455 RepID=UPI0039EBECE9